MTMTLSRLPTRDGTTLGRLAIDGVFVCETLEDAVHDGPKVSGQTAIPAGTYPVTITRSARFGAMLPLVVGVPGFTGIRIHAGNSARDTEGCILVGRYHTGAWLEHSRDALAAVMERLAPAVARGDEVTLTIENAAAEALTA